MGTDIHADVPTTPDTLAARINELYHAMLTVEKAGASVELTAAITALSERYRELQAAHDRIIETKTADPYEVALNAAIAASPEYADTVRHYFPTREEWMNKHYPDEATDTYIGHCWTCGDPRHKSECKFIETPEADYYSCLTCLRPVDESVPKRR